MRRRTPAQLRNQLLRRPRRLPAPFFDEREAERENHEIKVTCENRMQVFDAAPRHIRNAANEYGENVVAAWVEEQLEESFWD